MLDKSLTTRARPLGVMCSEGPAVSRKRMHIAWTIVAAQSPYLPAGSSRIKEADIVFEGGQPQLAAYPHDVIDSGQLPFHCTLETQNFVPPEEILLTFSAYGYQGTEVCGVNLNSRKVYNYSQAPGQYDENDNMAIAISARPDGSGTA